MKTVNHEYFVSLEVAKLLKEAGFDWRCMKCYNNGVLFDMESDEIRTQVPQHSSYDVLTPTLDVAQRWLREVKGYSIYPTYGGYKIYVLDINDSAGFSRTYGLNSNLTYEEAQEAGIKKALEIILEKGE